MIEGTDEPRVAEDLAALVRIKSLREELGELNPGAALWDSGPREDPHGPRS